MKIMFDSKEVNRTKTFKAEKYPSEGSGNTVFFLLGNYNINIADGIKVTFYSIDADGNKQQDSHVIKPELVHTENFAEWNWAVLLLDESGSPAPLGSFYDAARLFAAEGGYNNISLAFNDFEQNVGVKVYAVEITGIISDLITPISTDL